MKKEKKDVPAEEPKEGDILSVKPYCHMKVCEDPVTGEIKLVYSKGCPRGYIERVAGKIATRGVSFAEEEDKEDEKTV